MVSTFTHSFVHFKKNKEPKSSKVTSAKPLWLIVEEVRIIFSNNKVNSFTEFSVITDILITVSDFFFSKISGTSFENMIQFCTSPVCTSSLPFPIFTASRK